MCSQLLPSTLHVTSLVESDLAAAVEDLAPFVGQITLRLDKFFGGRDNPPYPHYLTPTGLKTLVSSCLVGRDSAFTSQLYYTKEKYLFDIKKSDGAYVINPESFENQVVNLPKLFVKIDRRLDPASLAGLVESGVDGLVYKADTLEEATEFITGLKKTKGAHLEVHAEVAAESLVELAMLSKAGYSRVQLPGETPHMKVDRSNDRDRTC